MSKKDGKKLIRAACEGEMTAQEAMRVLRRTGFKLSYPYAVTITLSGAKLFINYASTRVWCAYNADGEHVGEYVDGQLQPYVDAAIGQQRTAL